MSWHFQMGFVYSGGSYAYNTTGGFSNYPNWSYVVWVFDGTQTGNANRLKLYINGSQVTLAFVGSNVPAALLDSGTTHVVIGNNAGHGAPYMYGIDEVQLYSVAWSSATVTTGYNAGAGLAGAPGDAGLLAGWHFDEASGNAVNYQGNAAWNGVMNGTVLRIAGVKALQSAVTNTSVTVVSSIAPAVAGDGNGITTFGDANAGTIITGKYINFASATVTATATITNLTVTGSCTGCGGGADPTKVLKAGDTMTGALNIDHIAGAALVATGTVQVGNPAVGWDVSFYGAGFGGRHERLYWNQAYSAFRGDTYS
jgi:hypothetical protein